MRAKRLVYLAHRWTGVAGCLLMVLWFASGVVMLFVGYPKLTPWERLGALPALPAVNCCAPPDGVVDEWHAAQVGLVLTTIAGRPQFVLQDGGRPSAVPPGGAREGPITLAQALAEAQAFAPGAPLHHAGMVYEDRWTHARSLDLHRPLHRIAVGGNRPGDLYVSSATGQIVLDAPRVQQYWNYAAPGCIGCIRCATVRSIRAGRGSSSLCLPHAPLRRHRACSSGCGDGASAGDTNRARARLIARRGCAGIISLGWVSASWCARGYSAD